MRPALIKAILLCTIIALPGKSLANKSTGSTGTGGTEPQRHINSDQSCGRVVKMASWQIESWITCLHQCDCHLKGLCRQVVFNPQTMTCTPVAPIGTATLMIFAPGDVLYTTQDALPVCDRTKGFELHNWCGAFGCMYLSNGAVDYNTALSDCDKANGILYSANTEERFFLLWIFSIRKSAMNTEVFIGLRFANGVFSWSNGEELSAEQNAYVWQNDGSNSTTGGAICVTALSTDKNIYLIQQSCDMSFRFVCEQKQSATTGTNDGNDGSKFDPDSPRFPPK
ncbi:hypothetical protein PoB_002405200 [Plakobranchus ocellatus]|uniref:C-type lectin domain-containing protein n=1 Tax=Plakobranchus ocellatus TaxID=259542 RepID=A0AAV3ZQT4_9GAST|nr:hypothetical protein PoB_002405200 [Plakobranchus ocellatus]